MSKESKDFERSPIPREQRNALSEKKTVEEINIEAETINRDDLETTGRDEKWRIDGLRRNNGRQTSGKIIRTVQRNKRIGRSKTQRRHGTHQKRNNQCLKEIRRKDGKVNATIAKKHDETHGIDDETVDPHDTEITQLSRNECHHRKNERRRRRHMQQNEWENHHYGEKTDHAGRLKHQTGSDESKCWRFPTDTRRSESKSCGNRISWWHYSAGSWKSTEVNDCWDRNVDWQNADQMSSQASHACILTFHWQRWKKQVCQISVHVKERIEGKDLTKKDWVTSNTTFTQDNISLTQIFINRTTRHVTVDGQKAIRIYPSGSLKYHKCQDIEAQFKEFIEKWMAKTHRNDCEQS